MGPRLYVCGQLNSHAYYLNNSSALRPPPTTISIPIPIPIPIPREEQLVSGTHQMNTMSCSLTPAMAAPPLSLSKNPRFLSPTFPINHSLSFNSAISLRLHPLCVSSSPSYGPPPCFAVVASSSTGGGARPLKIMISGAPASGKGTQCELITSKYGLVHIAAGDLLRAEIASGSDNGKLAKDYMDKGQLVPDEIVVKMVRDRLLQPDVLEKGWLLDGYPRSLPQAIALKDFGFQPDLFILLDVPEELLVERVVGRRLDPVTGKIYHLTYSPPENDEIASRLTQRFDDTEEKVKLRLKTHNQNVDAVLSMYEGIIVKIDGSVAKDQVFSQIDVALSKLSEEVASSGSVAV